jgi:PAS domain-containing protein
MSEERKRDAPTALYDLQIADARWRAVLATARDAIICIDPAGRVTLFNPAAEEVFGLSRRGGARAKRQRAHARAVPRRA